MTGDTLDLTLRPPSPLGADSARLVIGGAALLMALAALRFLFVGAWPVLPFMLVDLALLAWAFRASRRAARAFERLRLTGEHLLLERTDARGNAERWELPRAWTRVELEPYAPQNRLWLHHRRRRLLIGRHLNRRERGEVYEVIARALNR